MTVGRPSVPDSIALGWPSALDSSTAVVMTSPSAWCLTPPTLQSH
jgi:hypothetical protein